MGAHADRPLHPREAGGEGPDARRRRRPADADPPGLLRPDRPAADARGGRRVRRRRVARRLREGGRPAARQRRTTASGGAGTGSTSPATPRATATSSTTTAPSAWHYRDFVIRALQRRHAVRPVRPRAARRRRARAGRRRRRAPRPASSWPGRSPRQITAKTTSSRIALRPARRHGRRRVGSVHARPDGRLRPLPRPQVRPDPAGRLLPPGRRFADTDAAELKLDPDPEVQGGRRRRGRPSTRRSWRRGTKFGGRSLPGRVEQWEKERHEADLSAAWLVLDADGPTTRSANAGRTTLRQRDDGSLLAGQPRPGASRTRSSRTRLKEITGLRLEALADPSLPKRGPGVATDGNFLLTRMEVTAAPLDRQGRSRSVKLKPIGDRRGQGRAAAPTADDNGRRPAGRRSRRRDQAAAFELREARSGSRAARS